MPRARQILLRAYDRKGRRFELKAGGFTARVIQHETDHLDGVLFFDRMTSFETLTFLDEFGRYWSRRRRTRRQGRSSALPLERAFRAQPLELHFRVIGELHRRGDGAWPARAVDQRCICWQTRR